MFRRLMAIAFVMILATAGQSVAEQAKDPPVKRGPDQVDDAADVVNTLRATNELIGMLDAYATIQAQQALQLGDERSRPLHSAAEEAAGHSAAESAGAKPDAW